ncbi:hypothetical protein DESC_70040 [Desulfosarcina cetonica]|nr:hypothetical protein DESC_70040 [Desulfosarcina cetonica]
MSRFTYRLQGRGCRFDGSRGFRRRRPAGVSGRLPVAALPVGTDVLGAVPFGGFLEQVWAAADRAGDRHGFVPTGEAAFRIAVAAVKNFAPLGGFLHDLAVATRFRTGHPRTLGTSRAIERLGMLAGRVAAAGQKVAIPAAFDHHGFAAFFTDLVRGLALHWGDGRDRAFFIPRVIAGISAFRVSRTGQKMSVFAHFDVQFMLFAQGAGQAGGQSDALDAEHAFPGLVQFPAEGTVKLLEQCQGFHFGLLDAVQVVFQARGEFHIQDFGKAGDEQIVDDEAQLRGVKVALEQFHVSLVPDRGKNRGIGAGPADAVLLQFLDQRGFGKARRRLGEMLFGLDAQAGQGGPLRKLGQRLAALVAFGFVVGTLVDGQEPGKFDRGAAGGENVAGGGDGKRLLIDQGLGHLRRHEALPDHRVQGQLVLGKVGFHLFRGMVDRCGSDGLVGILSLVLVFEKTRLAIGIVLAELLGDQGQGFLGGLVGDARGVGSHVGDQTDGFTRTEIDALVQLLGHHHGFFGGETQLADRFLLQFAGDEGRQGIALGGAFDDLVDHEGGGLQIPEDRLGGGLVGDLDFFASLAHQLGGEGRRALAFQVGRDRPVFDRFEDLDGPFTIADDAHGHGLHAAGTESAFDLAPQERRNLVTHQTVQDAAGLLGFVLVAIQVLGGLHGFENGPFGQFVEEDPMEPAALLLEHLGRVPGDGLALAVRVGGQVNVHAVAGRGFELVEDLGLARDGPVVGREILFDIDAQVFTGQILDMPDGGGDIVVVAQIFFDGSDLCG